MTDKLRLGVSACLLGQKVRYDGQHKLDRFIVDTLGRYVEFVPVCPEVECGLGVPRESMRLVGTPEAPRLMTTRTHVDLTDRMLAWARKRVRELASENLCGFVFKARSPSSGMERVKVYGAGGGIAGNAAGLFAGEFMRVYPLLPAEEEGRLNDPVLRENFIERLFALDRYRQGPARTRTARALMEFHAANKFLFMSHDARNTTLMGRLAAEANRVNLDGTMAAYEDLLLRTLALIATPAKQANVLRHMQGYFKTFLTADEKAELGEVIGAFKTGLTPLIVPVTLIAHYTRKHDVSYLRDQTYLYPHPLEMKLRNHA